MQGTHFLKTICWLIFFAAAAPAWESTVSAEVRLPRVFGSHMVLQQQKPLVLWGWSDPNESVTVTLGSETKPTKANDRGEWKVSFPARKAGGPWGQNHSRT